MLTMLRKIMGFQMHWLWYRTVLMFSTVRLFTVKVSQILSLLSWGISCSNYTSVAAMPDGPSSLCHDVLFDIWWRCQSVFFFTFRHDWGWQERVQQRGNRGERRQHAQGDRGFLITCCLPLQRNQFIVVHTAGHFKNEKSGGIEQRTQAIHSALKSPSKSVEQSGLPDLASSVYSHWFWLGRETWPHQYTATDFGWEGRLSLVSIQRLILAGKGVLASSVCSHWFWLGRET